MRAPLPIARPPKLSLEERLARAEQAYCEEFSRRLLEFELDPANFTQEMRDRRKGGPRP